MLGTLGTRKGLLELYHVPHDTQNSYATGNEKGALGFGHVGFTVPDVGATIERLKKVCPDLEVLKGLGEDSFASMGVPYTGEGGEDSKVEDGYKAVFRQLAFVKDPDGYWVELVPEKVK
jgi:lactoylglutathione lyase